MAATAAAEQIFLQQRKMIEKQNICARREVGAALALATFAINVKNQLKLL